MMTAQLDPFVKLLSPVQQFADQEQYASHLQSLASALSWVDHQTCCVVVADALVHDCPIVAVSDQFLNETGYPRSKVLNANFCFLLDNVSGEHKFRMSKSKRKAVQSYCQLARFPGAVNSANAMTISQPSTLYNGTVVNNDFTLLRVYVAEHPFLIGISKFSSFEQANCSGSEDCNMADRADWCLRRISKLFLADPAIHKILGCQTNGKQCASESQGLYCGLRLSPYLLCHNQGFGILRQEPHLLCHSGVIVTAEPLKPQAQGYLEYSLMVETVSNWSGDWPMGFTKTPPGSSLPSRLHFSPEHVGFTTLGAVCNRSKETVPATQAGMSKLQRWPTDELPKLQRGDVVTVQLHESGHLSRYLNGKLMCTIATGVKPEGTWYGAFEISMSVSNARLVNNPNNTQAHAKTLELQNIHNMAKRNPQTGSECGSESESENAV
jgi:hypothetical protein